jgi:cytochrome b6-f complex iron-sulfur subunit
MSKKDRTQDITPKAQKQLEKKAIRDKALESLGNIQNFLALAFFLSAALGIYLLLTDNSLWLLAASHAYGLVAIIIIDVALGIVNVLHSSKVVLPSILWSILTIFLQLGDIFTAPQYKMTIPYFAGYLFGLWAFDGILLVQVGLIFLGLSARKYQKLLVRQKQQNYFQMGFQNSRRDFLQIIGTIGAFVVIAGALGAWISTSQRSGTGPSQNSTQTSNLPPGAVANVNDLQVGAPSTFDYPSSGYTNFLFKESDGSVSALSALCTHVCCECQFDSSANNIACPCHGSVFDLNGNVLRGPASSPLPSVKLSIDSNGNIFPVKVVGSGPCVSGS